MREALVRTRTKYISLTRALLRREGIRIRSGQTEQIRAADKRLAKLVEDDEVVARLCTVPSVGAVTAATFVAVGRPGRALPER